MILKISYDSKDWYHTNFFSNSKNQYVDGILKTSMS